MELGVSLEEGSFKLTAAEIFFEECPNRRRASVRAAVVQNTRPFAHVLLCEI